MRINRIPLLRTIVQVTSDYSNPKRGLAYWQTEHFSCPTIRVTVRFFGRPAFHFTSKVQVHDLYLRRDNSLFFSFLDMLIAEKLVPPIDATSRIFESGCNVGGVLHYLQKKFGCAVYGVDISPGAIKYAQEYTFKGKSNACFFCENVLNYQFFKQFSDNYFSHVLCVSHLLHVPSGEEKKQFMAELKRIGRCVILYERVMPLHDVPVAGHVRYHEDYEKLYGFTLFKKVRKLQIPDKEIGVFYYTKE